MEKLLKILAGITAALLLYVPVHADEAADVLAQLDALIAADEQANGTDSHTTDTAFADLPRTHWAYGAVTALVRRGILSGMGDGLFCPDDSVTRAQYTKMLVLAAGLYDPDATGDFADVDASHWGYAYIASAFDRTALGTDSFRPDEPITREDMAVFTVLLMRRAGFVLPEGGGTGAQFADWDEVSPAARESVSAMAAMGMISGVGDGRFDPKGHITRAAAAKILYGVVAYDL